MKLHVENFNGLNAVTAYGDGFVEIKQQRYPHSIYFTPRGEVQAWPVPSFTALNSAALNLLLNESVEIVLLGTGSRQRFPAAALLKPFVQRGVGIEVMASQAACRTYNILMAENRQVALAVIIENENC